MAKGNSLPVRWSSVAKDRLVEVYLYIESKTSPETAEKITLELADTAETAGRNPFAYSECRELPAKTRIYRNIIYRNYRIVYKITRENVFILDVFHCKRNPDELKKLRRINI